MTHLRIKQNNGAIEEVSSAVISKLYDIVHSGNLDNTSNLIGRLHVSATYQDYIDYLEDTFKVNGVKQLIIDATKKYMSFEDPAVQSVLATTYGDGVGVTQSELQEVTNIGTIFKNNTNITKFNEFQYFTGITKSYVNWHTDMWFYGCTNLREITIPKKVKNFIADAACFGNCTSLQTVTFPQDSELEEIGGFQNCTSLQTISIPNSTLKISDSGFYSCTSLSSIDTNNVTWIDNNAFKLCTNLTTISFPHVQKFGNECFSNAPLNSVTFDNNSVQIIGAYCFSGCNLTNNNISFPNLQTLGPAAFGWTKISQVSNLGSITTIQNETFRSCTLLTSVTLPSTVTSIGGYAFNGCSALTTIDLSNVTSIGSDVFNGCTSLGQGQTLELNLTDQTAYPHHMLCSTKYTRLILHSPQQQNTYDSRYPLYEDMNQLQYLDLSDWRPAKSTFDNNNYGDGSFYGNNSLVTYIAPITVNNISTIINQLGNYSNFRYLILLPTTPPALHTTDSNNPPAYWFYGKSGNVHIYVPDSAKAAYLADTDWASIGGYNGSDTITDRLHGLSELPNGVWTTGLASQYLTPAQLATS